MPAFFCFILFVRLKIAEITLRRWERDLRTVTEQWDEASKASNTRRMASLEKQSEQIESQVEKCVSSALPMRKVTTWREILK
jgi:hypothetical protein